MDGTLETRVGPIRICCISPEARDLLDRIMEAWEEHLVQLKEHNGQDYEPSHYGFAYWLVRWSGLVEPSGAASTGVSTGVGDGAPKPPESRGESQV